MGANLGFREFVLLLMLGLAAIAAKWWDETHPFPVAVIRNGRPQRH